MQRHIICLPALCTALLFPTVVRAGHAGGGAAAHGGAAYGHRYASHSERMPGVNSLRPVPITRPVDLVWPPLIIESPGYAAVSPSPADPELEPNPEVAGESEVEVKLDDCMDDAALAGYNFSERRVVSCEDSTVDIYLSFSQEGGYFFLVPEDTQIKDIGPRTQLRSVRLIKPVDWSANHAASLMAGHVYVVWASTGDLYLVKVDALWEKHVMFGWVWHSHLSREAAEKFLKDNAGGPPGAPYFTR